MNVGCGASSSFSANIRRCLSGCWEGLAETFSQTAFSTHGQWVSFVERSANFGPVGQRRNGFLVLFENFERGRGRSPLVPGALARVSGNSEMKIEELQSHKGMATRPAMRFASGWREWNCDGEHWSCLFEGFAHFTIERALRRFEFYQAACFDLMSMKLEHGRRVCAANCTQRRKTVSRSRSIPAFFREWPSERGAVSTTEDPQGQNGHAVHA